MAAEGNKDGFAILLRAMAEQVARHTKRVVERTGRTAVSGPVIEAPRRVPRHTFV